MISHDTPNEIWFSIDGRFNSIFNNNEHTVLKKNEKLPSIGCCKKL